MSDSIDKDDELILLGQRLAELRDTLSEITGVTWSQDKVAKELNVTKNVIFRLERGQGSITKFLNLLLFYHDQGLNIFWAIDLGNPHISKLRNHPQEDTSEDVNAELRKIYEHLGKIVYGKL